MLQTFIVILIHCLFHVLVVFNSIAQRKGHLDSLNATAKSYARRQIAMSDSIADEVVKVAKQHSHYLQMAYALKIKSQNRICSGQFAVAILDLKQAVALFEKYNDPKEEAQAYANLTSAHRNLSQLDSAKMYNNLHRKIAIELKDFLLFGSGLPAEKWPSYGV